MARTIAFVFVVIAIGGIWLVLLSQGGIPKNSFISAAALVGGPFAIVGAALNWDFFFSDDRAQPFVDLLGRGGARVFYMLLGAALAGFGLWAIASGFFTGA